MKRYTSVRLFKQRRHTDFWIAILAITFSLFGLLMIFEASNVAAFRDFGDKYYYVKEQVIWFIFGIIGLLVTSLIPYKKYYQISLPLFIATIIFLIAVFIPGIGVKALGASRWIKLGIINFQPSELAKLSLIFYLAAWFSNPEKKRLTAFLLLMLVIIGLVIAQPDLGTAIILLMIAIIMYLFSNAPIWHFLMLIPISIGGIILFAVSAPYRVKRLITFLNPDVDPLGASYHIRQILISLGSGGLFGVGIGASTQKYEFLPEATTDSIFAIIGEEFGYIGAVLFITLLIIFFFRIFQVAKKTPDRFGGLLAGGVLALLLCQFAINLGSIVAILPLTGVPLPFISYGGSNLVVTLTSIGILLNISKHSRIAAD